MDVFGDAVRDAGPDSSPAALFSRLRRRWVQAPPNLDKNFLESVKPFVKIHEALRDRPETRRTQPRALPGTRQPPSDGPGPAATRPRATIAPTSMPSSRCSRPWRTPGSR